MDTIAKLWVDYDVQPIRSIFLPDYRHPCYSRDRGGDRLEKIVSQVGKRDSQAGNLPSCSTVLVLRRRRLADTLRVGVSELGKEFIDEEATGTIDYTCYF